MEDQAKDLKALGSKTIYKYDLPDRDIIEVFPNNYPDSEYLVKLETKEFTSLCPKTGQPDFGQIIIDYAPKRLCIESKSFKLYMFAFRNYKSFMESIVNKIADDLIAKCDPSYMQVVGIFNARGGIDITVNKKYFCSSDNRG